MQARRSVFFWISSFRFPVSAAERIRRCSARIVDRISDRNTNSPVRTVADTSRLMEKHASPVPTETSWMGFSSRMITNTLSSEPPCAPSNTVPSNLSLNPFHCSSSGQSAHLDSPSPITSFPSRFTRGDSAIAASISPNSSVVLLPPRFFQESPSLSAQKASCVIVSRSRSKACPMPPLGDTTSKMPSPYHDRPGPSSGESPSGLSMTSRRPQVRWMHVQKSSSDPGPGKCTASCSLKTPLSLRARNRLEKPSRKKLRNLPDDYERGHGERDTDDGGSRHLFS